MEGGRDRVAAKRVGGLVRSIGKILFPHFCIGCGSEGAILCRQCVVQTSAPLRGVFLCPVCGRPGPFGSPCPDTCRRRSSLDGAVSLASYGHPVLRRLLHEYKYEGVEEAGAVLENMIVSFTERRRWLLSVFADRSVVVPAPLHFFRLARRGFNQSDRFAKAIGRKFSATVDAGLLRRRFGWKHQAQIASPALRRGNVRGSIYLRNGAVAPGRYVVVDDVMTTGATIEACAQALKGGGAEAVWALTVLRG